jgi:hypothetical protein
MCKCTPSIRTPFCGIGECVAPPPVLPLPKHPAVGKQAVKAICRSCSHEWDAAYLPMPILDFARLAGSLCCPNCAAATSDIFVKAMR